MDYREGKQLRRLESKKKISLPVWSKAEDTLKTLRLTGDTAGYMQESGSPSKSSRDSSGSDDSVVSGPSSPSAALHSLRCRGCERLFDKIRRQEPPRKNRRADNPALLSCDEWLLKKRWQPQRLQQVRGRLWVHLKHIRLRAVKQSDGAWEPCSRPHVFLQRNLRRCKKLSGKLPQSKGKPLHQPSARARATRLLTREHYPRRKRRKSIETDDPSEHLSISSDLTVTSEDELPGCDLTHREDLKQQLEKEAQKQKHVRDVTGWMDIQADGAGLEGTRRVLKFDTSLDNVRSEETRKTKHRLVPRSTGGNVHEGQLDVTVNRRLDGDLSEDSGASRAPTDCPGTQLRMSRKKSGPSRPLALQRTSFRTMLAALGQGQGQKQIIKETHH